MQVRYRRHAARRMLQRNIGPSEVEAVLATGDVIERYPDDKPYPTRLILGWVTGRPLHVTAAETPTGVTLVITVYEPAPDAWDETFRIRRWERR